MRKRVGKFAEACSNLDSTENYLIIYLRNSRSVLRIAQCNLVTNKRKISNIVSKYPMRCLWRCTGEDYNDKTREDLANMTVVSFCQLYH